LQAVLLNCLDRGPHKSALDHVDFVREEFADFSEKGFWTVLPYDHVKDFPNLQLSPLGVMPQREQRPCLIVDLSFWGVNDTTVRDAPSEAMQFGRAFEHLMVCIRHADCQYGPVYISKLALAADGAPALAVLLPQLPGEPPLVGIPLCLPMGWVESPPVFCSVTKTIANMANQRSLHPYAPPHCLERIASTPSSSLPQPRLSPALAPGATIPSLPAPPLMVMTSPLTQLLGYVDVYMDDFIGLVQGTPRRRKMLCRVLMHAINKVFCPPSLDELPAQQEPLLVKKMK